ASDPAEPPLRVSPRCNTHHAAIHHPPPSPPPFHGRLRSRGPAGARYYRSGHSCGVPTVIIYGINPVLEALRAGRVTELRVAERGGDRIREVLALAGERGVRVLRVAPDVLARQTRGGVHQGVLADVADIAEFS